LWEAYIVEGLAEDRVALIIKSHQALVDGSHTVDLAQVMVDETARIRDVPADHWQPRPAPGAARLLLDSMVADVRSPREAAGVAAHRVGQLARATLPVTANDVRGPLSAALSRQRRYVTVATELEDYRRVREQHGGTVNDVVLATITGGLRGWLFTRGEPVGPTMKIRALVPMSVLDEQQPTSLGSAVVGHLLSLPVGESNPVVRLHQVSYALKAHKETGRAVAAGKLAALPGFVPTTFHAIGARIVHEHPAGAYQLAITNVPGSQEPLFVAGARMVQTYPALPLTEGHVLSIGATSYAGGVYLGLVSDRDAMPDVAVLAACLSDALQELVESASTRTRAPRGRKRPEET
jgi:diacylglycerol O-acyltransferase